MAHMMQSPPLEDELGDVLDKALKLAGMREDVLASRTGIDVNRIKDALDYRYDLDSAEVGALAKVLHLNEPGLRALVENRYPQPEPCGLPFRLQVLPMPYGVGVVNAYLVTRCDSTESILFDSGSCPRALARAWPPDVRQVVAHFVTHWDSDHAGGCGETMARFHLAYCFGPGPSRATVRVLADGEKVEVAGITVQTIATPGPAREHHCYLVGRADRPGARRVLCCGDLFFCGSIGGGLTAPAVVLKHARRLWNTLPPETVVAPGHGPLTTIETERDFNPFGAA